MNKKNSQTRANNKGKNGIDSNFLKMLEKLLNKVRVKGKI